MANANLTKLQTRTEPSEDRKQLLAWAAIAVNDGKSKEEVAEMTRIEGHQEGKAINRMGGLVLGEVGMF